MPAGGPTEHLLNFLAELTDAGDVVTTGTHLTKANYVAPGVPTWAARLETRGSFAIIN